MSMKFAADERGFTLAELLVASMVTMLVLGGAVTLTSQVQAGYRRAIEDAAAEQEGRYALEWVSRLIRGAGNNPYGLPAAPPAVQTGDCPAAATAYSWLIMDPNGDGDNDDIRIQTDSNPPDGLLGGIVGIARRRTRMSRFHITRRTSVSRSLTTTWAAPPAFAPMPSSTALNFIYRDASHNPTVVAANVIYVETQVRVRTRTLVAATGLPETRTLSQEVRIRGRNY